MAELEQAIIGERSKALANFGRGLLPSLIRGDMKDESKGTNEVDKVDLTHLIQRIKADNQGSEGVASQLSISYIEFADGLLEQMNGSRKADQNRSNSSQFEHLHKHVASLQLKNDSYRQRLRECFDLIGE